LNVTIRFFSLLAIPAAFLLGWVAGSNQTATHQPLQQDNVADQTTADGREVMLQ